MCETKLHRHQGGASIITAIFLITGLAILAALMSKLTIFGATQSVKEWHAAQALYAAESAISAAVYDITNTSVCGARNGDVDVTANSTGTYTFTCNQPGNNGQTVDLYEITATGTAGSGDLMAERRIIVQFIP